MQRVVYILRKVAYPIGWLLELRYTTAGCYFGYFRHEELRLTTSFPPQTSNRLRFSCTATGCPASRCLYKNRYVRLNSTFIRQRLDQCQLFPSLVSILLLPKLRFASQLFLEPPVIPTTKQNKLNTDKMLDFSTGRVFVRCDKSENTKLIILIKYILNSPA